MMATAQNMFASVQQSDVIGTLMQNAPPELMNTLTQLMSPTQTQPTQPKLD